MKQEGIRIRIPATSANIGAGFDALGLAVNLYNEVYMQENEGIQIISLDGAKVPLDANNLIYKTAKYLYDVCGKKLPGLLIKQTSAIPMARGLGSSSACIVAGLMGANELMGTPLTKEDLVHFAATLEGHPDNSTPAILGGLVTSVIENGKVYCVKQEIKDDLRFAALIPDFELKTSDARSVIPKEIRHKDAVYNLSRASLMALSLYSGHYENLRVACGDSLHQPYRLSLIPGAREVMALSYKLDAYAAYLSGAGPTLMAIIPRDHLDFEPKARLGLDQLGLKKWQIKILSIDNHGCSVLDGAPVTDGCLGHIM